ncbi:TPA: LPXTG cell wall anchor domain-containing protein [Streptococcus suis]
MNTKKLVKWGVALASVLVLGGVVAPVSDNLATTSAVVYAEDVTPYTVEYYLDGQLWGMVNYGYRRGWPYVKAVPDDLSFPNIDEIELVSSSIADPWRSTKEEIIATGGVLRYYWVRKGGVSQPAETPTEKPVEQPSEQPTDQPVEQPVEQPAETPTEQPVEQPVETPTEKPVEQPAETKPAEIPTEKPVEQPAETKPAETPTEKPAEQPAEQPAETKPAETPTEKPVEQPVEKPVEKPVEQPAEKTIVKPTAVPEEVKVVNNSTPSANTVKPKEVSKPTTKTLPNTGDSVSVLSILGGFITGIVGVGLATPRKKK